MNNLSSGCYIIDAEYNVVNVNETARKTYPQLQVGKKCYNCLMGIHEPCGPCPVAAGRKGPATYTDPIRNISEIVDAVDIEIEGVGPCHMLIFSTVENEATFAATLPTNEEELKTLALIKALTLDYYDVLSVNLQNNKTTIYRLNGKAVDDNSLFKNNIIYQEQLENYIQKFVIPEDQQMMRECNSIEYLRQALKQTESVVFHYRILWQDEIHYFYRKIARIGAADSFENIVIGIGAEDEIVKNKQKQRVLQDTLRKVETDTITGLLSSEALFVYGDRLLTNYPEKSFDLCILKIDNLDSITRQYGELLKNQVIETMGDVLKKYEQETNCIGYFGEGTFVSFSENMSTEARKESIALFQKVLAEESKIKNIILKWSVYKKVNRDISTEELYRKVTYILSTIRPGLQSNYIEVDQLMLEKMDWDLSVENNFKSALAKGEFVIWYQPKYAVDTQKIIGAEALVRWQLDDGKLIPPNRFIPVLENSGLINLLDEEVFRQVCKMQSEMQERGYPKIPISVNLSRASIFTKDIAQSYSDIADEYGVEHHRVPIEITESAAVRAAMIGEFADSLIANGFVLQMDDFGAGYSSLASLQMIPFEGIKIDKSLVDFIGQKNGESLLKHTIAFAKESGMNVVAEGVETLEQFVFFKFAGCDSIQGYYFSKPVEKETFLTMLTPTIRR